MNSLEEGAENSNIIHIDNIYKAPKTREFIIEGLEKLLSEIEYKTEEHVRRVGWLSIRVGYILNFSMSQLLELYYLAVLHDIGKIAIPSDILNKTTSLTIKEWELIKMHTNLGYHIVHTFKDLDTVAVGVLCHHEKWDGTGYPKGLKGDEIPLIARIISIIDSYDAMVSERSYRKAFSKEKAIEELRRCSGSQFDPMLVDVFVEKVVKGLESTDIDLNEVAITVGDFVTEDNINLETYGKVNNLMVIENEIEILRELIGLYFTQSDELSGEEVIIRATGDLDSLFRAYFDNASQQ